MLVKAKKGLVVQHKSISETMETLTKFRTPFIFDGKDVILGSLRVTSTFTIERYYDAYKVENLKDTINKLYDMEWWFRYYGKDCLDVYVFNGGNNYNVVHVGSYLLYCDIAKRIDVVSSITFEQDYEYVSQV